MTVILQHQFWDLAVTEQGFEVGMSFGGIPEKLVIPFDAISGFFDPSVQFGLQFEEIAEAQPSLKQDTQKPDGKKGLLSAITGPETSSKKSESTTRLPVVPPVPASVPAVPPLTPVATAEPTDPNPDKPSGGGEVVRLDRFRKK
jgi:hypothetical protein